MIALTGQQGRRLHFSDLSAGRDGFTSFVCRLETEAGQFSVTVHEHGSGPVPFLRDVAEQWTGWTGSKTYSSLEGQLTMSAEHDGLGTISIRVTICQPWPPEWSARAVLEVGGGADVQSQASYLVDWFESASAQRDQ